MKKETKIEILQKKFKGCDDSYFYDGIIATKKTKNGIYILSACGEIKLNCEDEPMNDKEVAKCYQNDHFLMNNWFEIWFEYDDDKGNDEEFGIFEGYDDGIKNLKKLN